MFLWIINGFHKISQNNINTSMHEFIFRIHNFFQQLLLLGMIQFFFNLNVIYFSDLGPAKNHT